MTERWRTAVGEKWLEFGRASRFVELADDEPTPFDPLERLSAQLRLDRNYFPRLVKLIARFGRFEAEHMLAWVEDRLKLDRDDERWWLGRAAQLLNARIATFPAELVRHWRPLRVIE